MPDSLPAELSTLFRGLDTTERAAREQLVRQLLSAGRSPQELLDAHAVDQLALLPLIAGLREDGTRTLTAVAAEYGVDPAALIATRQALGLPVDSDGAVYGAALEQHAQRLRDALEMGLSLESLVAFNYVIGAAAASIAGGARDSVLAALEDLDPAGNELTRATRGAALAIDLTPVLVKVVQYAVEEHLREMSRHQVTATLTSGPGGQVSDVTIAFADLVNFTALGDSVEPLALGTVAMKLERAARLAIGDDVTLVKTLGDAVMLAARTPGHMVQAVTRLRQRATESNGLPELRVGIAYGPALSRAGDWYGSVVNRASRLTALAQPGGVLADDSTHEQCRSSETEWQNQGPLQLRGLHDPVTAWSLVV